MGKLVSIPGFEIRTNSRRTSLETAGVGVSVEQLVNVFQGGIGSPLHLVIDSGLHILLNKLHIHPKGLSNSIGKKTSRVVEISIDAAVHVLCKYGAHKLLHALEHIHDAPHHLAGSMKRMTPQQMQEMQEGSGCDVKMLGLGVIACVTAEMIKKNFFDKRFHK